MDPQTHGRSQRWRDGKAAQFEKESSAQQAIAEYARKTVLSPDRAAVARKLRFMLIPPQVKPS
jgi:hypothetical protein